MDGLDHVAAAEYLRRRAGAAGWLCTLDVDYRVDSGVGSGRHHFWERELAVSEWAEPWFCFVMSRAVV